MKEECTLMIIEISRPELQILIRQRMIAGVDIEDVLIEALRASAARDQQPEKSSAKNPSWDECI